MDLSDELVDLYDVRPRNGDSIAVVYDNIFSQKKTMIIEMIEALNKVE